MDMPVSFGNPRISIVYYTSCVLFSECSGKPLVIMPNNSSGNLAFPEANLDILSGSWREIELYPEDVSCSWVLYAPPLHCFYLKALHFQTEENYDFVKVSSIFL